ncbi:hypothetical protein NGA_0138002 [Nannochloropsis gaditana CCMP526]|uniref:uncharacterized protein n=1 Tax=Nannochloropsis gaditana (strain CCMP526) TaxID=1093141 RepID=UPI00029F7791|nr:hypothetical protein NGA_0138002 [Nannochloropsis gaditana CCMP526]EKU22852.1 hypothetical protein NGA_0138002 [Nannochloropsis gaditana CCMP526]|eukprot:XP_005853510.1 hypothetical protein NGA_0138002 [Nannochloropsis gaditana CCMP526]
MAAVVQSHSTRFLGVALLPTGHLKGPGKEDEEEGASHEKDGMDILMEAYKHAVETCSLDGVALFVGPLSSPLDHPGFEALWKRCEEDGVPVWLHPNRPQSQNFDDTEGLALLDDMKKFYCDTATFGLAPLNIRQGLLKT